MSKEVRTTFRYRALVGVRLVQSRPSLYISIPSIYRLLAQGKTNSSTVRHKLDILSITNIMSQRQRAVISGQLLLFLRQATTLERRILVLQALQIRTLQQVLTANIRLKSFILAANNVRIIRIIRLIRSYTIINRFTSGRIYILSRLIYNTRIYRRRFAY